VKIQQKDQLCKNDPKRFQPVRISPLVAEPGVDAKALLQFVED